ncbi:PLDc N-terminal domain-containing protein [Mycetocola reblochoni]|uniref:Membrane protein n=2 Tax=Mycetocola reblochoni TaxID=331618 RepID=A0A1R4IXQ2_9MICO|nr:PLDc N-terminal domain-containing protein [Mycetocola reblochoni]RLP70926.1 hypothetical protein D9V30_00380 [Mycetocola reblochoni]SJN24479.1 Membrane protein [Mycetocola reblochoni REB411]
MLRLLLIAIPILVVVTIYAVVDCAMIAKGRIRGLSRPAWIVLILILPLIGLVLWFVIGRGPAGPVVRPASPDDDPLFLSDLDRADQDERIRELEEQLLAIDEEERRDATRRQDPSGGPDAAGRAPSSDGAADAADATPGEGVPEPNDDVEDPSADRRSGPERDDDGTGSARG